MIIEQGKEHGTAKAYNQGCRCDLCKKAKKDYRKNGVISGHGTKWYYDKGCRCELCTEAKNLYKRKNLGRQPRRITTNVAEKTRVCYSCKETKPLNEFVSNSNKRSFLGRSNECKTCNNKRKRKNKNKPGQRFSTYKSGAKVRNIIFDLTYEQFISFWNKDCYYCGKEIDGIGLDRKDSSEGYNINNIVPCCSQCNRSKTIQTTEQFITMCKTIAQRFNNSSVGTPNEQNIV